MAKTWRDLDELYRASLKRKGLSTDEKAVTKAPIVDDSPETNAKVAAILKRRFGEHYKGGSSGTNK